MSYCLNPAQPPAFVLKKVADEQMEKALVAVSQLRDKPEPMTHDIRKRLKKLRALLRFCREDVGENFYKEKNVSFRNAGRKLSEFRDLTVMQETLADLHEKYKGSLRQKAFSEIEKELELQKANVLEQQILQSGLAEELNQLFTQEKEALTAWPVSSQTYADLFSGTAKVYKRGYKAFLTNSSEAQPAGLHEWRKRVKYAWYHFRLLQPCWPEVWKVYSREWHNLSHYLGRLQDLNVLENKIATNENVSEETEQNMLLKSLLRTEHTTLFGKALDLGNVLYVEKPGHFNKRVKGIITAREENIHKSVH